MKPDREIPQLDIHPWYGIAVEKSKGIKKLLLRFLPMHTLKTLQLELPLIPVRWSSGRVARRFQGSDNMLVNIGCGPYGKDGWVNVDMGSYPHVNCVYDCRKSLPFPDESVRGIFCEHFFEHIDYTEEVPYFLSECSRVLKKGGVLRLIMPDGGRFLKAACEDGWEALTALRPLGPDHTDSYWDCRYNTKMELVNEVFRQGCEHKFAYDFETLQFVLLRYGFSEVVHQGFQRTLMPELGIDQARRAPESLYVDARK